MGVFPKTPEIQALIRSALREDNASSDITTRLLVSPKTQVEAYIVSKQRGVIAGLPFAQQIFKAFDPKLTFKPLVRDGDKVQVKTRLARIQGCARSVLSAERPALNAIQHLSGIATFTQEQVQRLRGSRIALYDTRKTLPGWRALQKYAVRCGGGTNHRMSLGAAVLIKENHLQIARAERSSWLASLAREAHRRKLSIQMEIQTAQDLRDAFRLQPEKVLLDNFAPRRLRPMIRELKARMPGIVIELSGGIRPRHLKALKTLKADRVSMGCLTHSVQAFDCSLDIVHVRP